MKVAPRAKARKSSASRQGRVARAHRIAHTDAARVAQPGGEGEGERAVGESDLVCSEAGRAKAAGEKPGQGEDTHLRAEVKANGCPHPHHLENVLGE